MYDTLHVTEKGGHAPRNPQYGTHRAMFHYTVVIAGGGGETYAFPHRVNALLIQCRANTGIATFLLEPDEMFGDQEILNGDFATNLDYWTPGTGWAWAAPGRAAVTAAPGIGALAQTTSTFEQYHYYHVEATITMAAGTSITITAGGVTLGVVVASGTYDYDFLAVNNNPLVFTPTVDVTGTVDNVSSEQCRPAEKPMLAGENYEIRGYPCDEVRIEASANATVEITGYILPEYADFSGFYTYE